MSYHESAGYFTPPPPLKLRKNPVITGKKRNSKIDLENFAKLTKCMIMQLVNYLFGLNYIF